MNLVNVLKFSDKFDQFWAVNKKLMDTSANEGEFKHIPFRLYTTDAAPFVQKLMKPYTEEKQQKILTNLIQEIYPNGYDKSMSPLYIKVLNLNN